MYKAGDTSWTSSRVDISFPESDLLSNLNGKWRNQLKAAQKSNIEVKIDQDRGGQRFTERYQLFQSAKGFQGLDLGFLGKLNELFFQSGKILILEAQNESVFYGAIVVVVHGKTATYLAGISEEDGRRSNVTNLLLWSAIQELKKRDVQFLDLGGLDFDGTPSIANFKMGLSGHVYQLLGEFLVIRI
jgi:lipid II:glycine glycyltransferase (peptidoglycan interpeptide bridge formation enzyme)